VVIHVALLLEKRLAKLRQLFVDDVSGGKFDVGIKEHCM
jgi:hypothetical protein